MLPYTGIPEKWLDTIRKVGKPMKSFLTFQLERSPRCFRSLLFPMQTWLIEFKGPAFWFWFSVCMSVSCPGSEFPSVMFFCARFLAHVTCHKYLLHKWTNANWIRTLFWSAFAKLKLLGRMFVFQQPVKLWKQEPAQEGWKDARAVAICISAQPASELHWPV